MYTRYPLRYFVDVISQLYEQSSLYLIWEEVCHSYTEAADAGDVVVGKRKSPKGNISNEHQRQ